MRQGRAHKRWVEGLFAIQMADVDASDAEVTVNDVDLKIDPGASAMGMAVTSDMDGNASCPRVH